MSDKEIVRKLVNSKNSVQKPEKAEKRQIFNNIVHMSSGVLGNRSFKLSYFLVELMVISDA